MGCDAFSTKMTMSTPLLTAYPQIHVQSPTDYESSFDLYLTRFVDTLFTQSFLFI